MAYAIGEIHKNDVGTVFNVTIKDQSNAIVDISAATTKQIIFTDPEGTDVAKTATFNTDGTDGKINYVILVDDLDLVGLWKMQAKVITPAGTWHSNITEFNVLDNLI
jgi:hypothetical protein